MYEFAKTDNGWVVYWGPRPVAPPAPLAERPDRDELPRSRDTSGGSEATAPAVHKQARARKRLTVASALLLLLAALLVSAHALGQSAALPPGADKERERLAGTWRVVTALIDGERYDDRSKVKAEQFRWEISADKLVFRHPEGFDEATYRLGPGVGGGPRTIDAVVTTSADNGRPLLGVYELNGDSLRLTFGKPGGTRRPADLRMGFMIFELRRQRRAVDPDGSTAGMERPMTAAPTWRQVAALPGRREDSHEVRAISRAMGGAPQIARYGDASHWTWVSRGMVVRFERGIVVKLRLHAAGIPVVPSADGPLEVCKQYPGELPAGISFADCRADVERKLGKPDREYEVGTGHYLAYDRRGITIGFWDDRIAEIEVSGARDAGD